LGDLEGRFAGQFQAQPVQARGRHAQQTGVLPDLPLLLVMALDLDAEAAEELEVAASRGVRDLVLGLHPHQHAARQPFEHRDVSAGRPSNLMKQMLQHRLSAYQRIGRAVQVNCQRMHEQ